MPSMLLLADAGVSVVRVLETDSTPAGSPGLLDKLAARGIPVQFQASVTSVSGTDRLESATTKHDGITETISCDLLIVSPYVVPE